jgi:hypothetical protein
MMQVYEPGRTAARCPQAARGSCSVAEELSSVPPSPVGVRGVPVGRPLPMRRRMTVRFAPSLVVQFQALFNGDLRAPECRAFRA